jgi:hypothetical protein
VATVQAEQIAAALATISDRLARIETKLDGLSSGHTDHEARIRALERTKWIAVGAAAAAGGLAGQLTQLLQ